MADDTTKVNPTNDEGGNPAPQPNPAPQANPAPQNPPAPQPDNTNLRTFTQEQLDAIIARERTKATKGLFTPEQMQAKDNTIASLTSERDAANADKIKLQAELDGYKNEKFLAGKGVSADMLDFYAFKIGKLVTNEKTFEQAAEEYLKENPPAINVRMSTGGSVGGNGGGQQQNANDVMNALIRGATK